MNASEAKRLSTETSINKAMKFKEQEDSITNQLTQTCLGLIKLSAESGDTITSVCYDMSFYGDFPEHKLHEYAVIRTKRNLQNLGYKVSYSENCQIDTFIIDISWN